MKRTTRLALIVSCLALLLGLALSEGLFRLAYWAIQTHMQQGKRQAADAYEDPSEFYGKHKLMPRMEYDTYLGFLPKASFSEDGYHTNAQHLRYDENLSENKPANEIRIFVTGGSAAWGDGVTQQKVFSAVAEKRLAQSGRQKIRVIDAGVNYFCSTQERQWIENRLWKLSPDIIVMFSGWNDAIKGYQGRSILEESDDFHFRQRLESTAYRLTVGEPPLYRDYDLKLRYLFDRLQFRLKYRLRGTLETELAKKNIPPEQVVATLLRNVSIVSDLARHDHYTFLFALQPELLVSRKVPGDWERSVAAQIRNEGSVGWAAYIEEVYRLYRKELPRHAHERGYRYWDADEAIAGEAKSVFIDTVHFGDRGNRLLGEAFAEKLKPMILR